MPSGLFAVQGPFGADGGARSGGPETGRADQTARVPDREGHFYPVVMSQGGDGQVSLRSLREVLSRNDDEVASPWILGGWSVLWRLDFFFSSFDFFRLRSEGGLTECFDCVFDCVIM